MHTIHKGSEKIMVQGQADATNLIVSLTVLGCTDAFKNQIILGNKEQLDVYEVSFLDKHIKVLTRTDAEKVCHWMLELGCQKVSIEKIAEEQEETDERGD